MHRGDVWLVAFDLPAERGEPESTRPAVIVSAERFNQTKARTLVVVPLTTTHRGHPLHVEIDHPDLDNVSYAQSELVGVISRDRLVHRVASVGLEAMAEIDERLRMVLDL